MTTSPRPSREKASAVLPVALLLGSFFVVGLLYQFWIRPEATATQARNAAASVEGALVAETNLATILADAEQQVCLSLFLWAGLLMMSKFREVSREGIQPHWPFEDLEEGERILPDTALDLAKASARAVAAVPGAAPTLLARAVQRCLHRFHATASVQETSQAVQELADSESNRLDSEMAVIRYTAWAIPSIGFIGTVRGIGQALARADEAIQGDVSGVTAALGTAFNSTFVALVLSIFLMLGVYTLQRRQEAHVLSVETFCRDHLIEKMKSA